ncbi:uncharacterized protein LOC118103010 [Hippoglossus stenolepis]|uniref:uncharacterized protein LOC118103010 n=1 Tax=Hippoglossus stenolepis TaxID=195615 RepID=UPI001FAF550D|nr:uncharacterized protein LOC118103010 [Hippoglossus stenolepis]
MGHSLLGVLSLFLLNTLLSCGHTESHKPRATVRASRTSIPVAGTLTLTCSVEESAGWSYDWFTRSPDHDETAIATNRVLNSISISHGGIYWCRGRRTNSDFFSEKSHVHHIEKTLSNRSFVVLQHNWTEIFSGETISVRCEIQGGGDTQWDYEWRTTSSHQPVTGTNTAPTHSEYRLGTASVFHSGEYWCKARADLYSSTEWSDAFQLRVTPNKPRPRLIADNTTITGKGSVALICSVDNAAEWRYDWFRRTSASSAAQIIRYNETDDEISISEEGIYNCRGRRGDTTFFTEDSNLVTIEKRVSHKASVALQPNWSLIFSGEMITVRCEVPADVLTEWEYEWTKPNSNTVPTHNEYRIVNVSSSDSGNYRCLAKDKKKLYSTTEWSNVVTLTVSERPAANLSADRAFPVGGSVLLTCSVGPSSPGWNYYWYRGEKTSEPLTDEDFKSNGQSASASHEGQYWCRGGRGDPVYYTEYSNSVSIHETVHNRAAVTLQPNWPNRYRGETVTLRCEIQGGDSEWEYEWTATSSHTPPNTNEFRISLGSHLRGSYWCQGRLKGARQNSTGWSVPVTLSNAAAPRPVFTVSPSWLTPGASVTLTCGVQHPTAGWRFYWYRVDPISLYPVPRCQEIIKSRMSSMDIPEYSYELLPGSNGGTEQNSYVIQGQTKSASYACRAGRGDPVFYTEYSETKWVWSVDSYSSVSLTVSPDRVQHFRHVVIHLTCKGNSDKWRLWMFSEYEVRLSECSRQETIPRFTWPLFNLPPGVVWCESGSELSNAVNITTGCSFSLNLFTLCMFPTSHNNQLRECVRLPLNKQTSRNCVDATACSAIRRLFPSLYSRGWSFVQGPVILESPVHPVTEGQSVTLRCSPYRRRILYSSFSFYKNGELLQSDVREKLEISAVSKSDEGFYKCEYSGDFSRESWMSHLPPSSPVPLVIGLVGGITLILFLSLLLLCWCRNSKNLCCDRLSQSLRTNQSSDPTVHHDEIQLQVYSSLLHGDNCIYESIRGDTEEGTRGDPEERSDYVNENPPSASGPL